jgi:hypothetical protein
MADMPQELAKLFPLIVLEAFTPDIHIAGPAYTRAQTF